MCVCALFGPALVSIAAQDPVQPPPPKPSPQQKADPSKKREPRQGAQSENHPQKRDNESIIIDTELVQLDVTVIDKNNIPVINLNKDDFDVYEDEIKQVISSVSREEAPLSIGFVIDTSGSMRSKLQTVSDAAISLIKQMRSDDEAFVCQFKTEPELVQGFTRDKRELEGAFGKFFTSGGTALLDAIIATADYAQEKGKQRRKALIVISDGLDKNSSVKEKQVMEAIKENEVQVYFIGFLDAEEPITLFGGSSNKKAKGLLLRLADNSGGRAFFPEDVEEMHSVATQIAKDMRTQYVISYYPTNKNRANENRDGTFRSVRVVVNSKEKRKLIARTRQGYYARTERGSSR